MESKSLEHIESVKKDFPTLEVKEITSTNSIICKVNSYVVFVGDTGEQGEKNLRFFLSGLSCGKRHS